MRRVRKLCWWVMTVCLGIAVLLSSYFAWDYNAAMGLLGDKPTAVVFFPYAAAALLIPVGYAFFGGSTSASSAGLRAQNDDQR